MWGAVVSQTFLGSGQSFPFPDPFPTFLRCQSLTCPGSTAIAHLLTHLIFQLFYPPPTDFLPFFYPHLSKNARIALGQTRCTVMFWQCMRSVFSAWLSHYCCRKRFRGLKYFHILNLAGVFCLFYYICFIQISKWLWSLLASCTTASTSKLKIIFPKTQRHLICIKTVGYLGSLTVKCISKKISDFFLIETGNVILNKTNGRSVMESSIGNWIMSQSYHQRWCLLGSMLKRCFWVQIITY